MALFMVKTWMGNKNPDDYFDPVTHIATEGNFIKFLECSVYDSKYIGYKVQLSNSAVYDNGLWIIAAVNHDSANTGQTNCYDLISEDCISSQIFGSSQNWRSSTIRTYLNNTFYPGLSSAIQPHIMNIKYNSQGSWYNDDKIILPSKIEVGSIANAYNDIEGTKYPIFTTDTSAENEPNASRIRYACNTITKVSWWTRSRNTYHYSLVSIITEDGSVINYDYNGAYYITPLLRVR